MFPLRKHFYNILPPGGAIVCQFKVLNWVKSYIFPIALFLKTSFRDSSWIIQPLDMHVTQEIEIVCM